VDAEADAIGASPAGTESSHVVLSRRGESTTDLELRGDERGRIEQRADEHGAERIDRGEDVAESSGESERNERLAAGAALVVLQDRHPVEVGLTEDGRGDLGETTSPGLVVDSAPVGRVDDIDPVGLVANHAPQCWILPSAPLSRALSDSDSFGDVDVESARFPRHRDDIATPAEDPACARISSQRVQQREEGGVEHRWHTDDIRIRGGGGEGALAPMPDEGGDVGSIDERSTQRNKRVR
jgi:hypothetical protein